MSALGAEKFQQAYELIGSGEDEDQWVWLISSVLSFLLLLEQLIFANSTRLRNTVL